MSSEAEYNAIIIGAGMAGLSCAAHLGRAGKKVVVLEQHNRPGGLWASFARRGVVFDISTHWVVDPVAVNHMLGELGAPPVEFERLHHLGRYMGPPGSWDLLAGDSIEEFKASARASCPDVDERALDRIIQKALRVERVLMGLPVYSGETSTVSSQVAAFFQTVPHLPMMLRYGRMPAERLLASLFPGERMSGIRAGLFTMAPISGMPAIGMLVMLGFALRGRAHEPRGGSQVLPDAFARAAEENGVETRYSQKVSRITTTSAGAAPRRGRSGRSSQVTGVLLESGEILRSRAVVSAADALQTFHQLLEPGLAPASFETVLTAQPLSDPYGLVSIVTDLDLEALGLGDCDVFVCPSDDVPAVLDLREPDECGFSLIFPKYRETGADPGLSGVQIVAPAAFDWKDIWATEQDLCRGAAYRALKHDWATTLIKRAEATVPGLSSHLVHVDVATPITVFRYTLNTRGAPVGWHYRSRRRWKQRVDFVRGLYQAGHWVGPSGALPAIRSGKWAAELVIADEGPAG
ncbi:MAG: NAD(P)/FAD-dependent oxidoreductase [Actinobacteria bacterium]|nr:NAD(P)/FAD-dependent oxidoreductase [Actinomycetota bacterium]